MARSRRIRIPHQRIRVRGLGTSDRANLVTTIQGDSLGTSVPSPETSTAALSAQSVTANGATTLTDAIVVRDQYGVVMAGVTVTRTLANIVIDPAASTIEVSPGTIVDDGADAAIVTVRLVDTETGAPVPGVLAAEAAPTSNETAMITPLGVMTNSNGVIAYSVTSTDPATHTLTSPLVTDTASLVVSGDPPVVTPWFEEAWDYADTAEMESDPNGWFEADHQDEPTLTDITLDTGLTTPWGGTTACKLSFDDMSGELPAGTEVNLGKNVLLPDAEADAPKEIWMEFYIKFDDVWSTTFGAGEFDHKTMFLLQRRVSGSNYRWDWRVGNQANANPGMLFQYAGQSSNYWLNTDLSGSGTGRAGANDYLWDGAWHVVRIHAKLSSDFEVTDAEKHMWIDGVKLAQQTGFFTPGEADGQPRATEDEFFQRLALGRNISRPNQAQAFWWGRIRIYVDDPGWEA